MTISRKIRLLFLPIWILGSVCLFAAPDFQKEIQPFLAKYCMECHGKGEKVKGKVDYHELSTPLSTRHFANYGRGEIYGAAATPERFRVAWLGPRTPIGGLFLTGQDAVAHGVTGALYAGLVSASAVLGRDVLRDVRRRVG